MTTWFPEGYPVRPKVYFPPGPPALSDATSNPNPSPYRYRYQPSRQSGSSSSTPGGSGTAARAHRSDRRESDPNAGYPQLDLVDGVDYFKIGDSVRVRRWTRATDNHSQWIVGQIERPVLVENEDGTTRRCYMVTYNDPRTGERKEKQFSPHFKEITSLAADPVTAATPTLRQHNKRNIVFVPIPVAREDRSGSRQVVYTPALVLTSPNSEGGVRLRILAGPAANREIRNFAIKYATPYSAAMAEMWRQKGFLVEGNGTEEFF